MILNSPYISGSSTITGNLTVLGSISGSAGNAISASYALNATSASYALNSTATLSSSYAATSSYADTFTVAGTLTAQKLVVQTITSSIVYSSGSNVFGNSVSNTQSMTGSVGISGSLAVAGALSGATTGVFTDRVTVGDLSGSSPLAWARSGGLSGYLYSDMDNVGFTNVLDFGAGYEGILLNASTSAINFYTNGISTPRLSIASTGAATFTGTLIQQNITDGTNLIGLNTSNSVRQFNLFSTTTYSSLGTVTNNPLLISTNDTERMRITSGGDVGIGSSTISNPPGIARVLNISSATNSGLVITQGANSYSIGVVSNVFRIYKEGTEKFSMDADGVVTIVNLAGAGSRAVNADASGNLSAASDSRLKQEVLDYKVEGLAEILKMQPRAYKWLSDIENRGENAATEIGFFANEVASIIPSAAPMGNDGYYGFYDRAVIAALVNAIQEQQTQIEELKLLIK